MSQSRPSAGARETQARQVAVYLTAHQLAKLSELTLLADSPDLEREILNRTRALVRLLEKGLGLGRPARGRNVVDIKRRLRLRALDAALGTQPDSPPPRRA